MHLLQKKAAAKVHAKEQRTGELSVAQDLRAIYMAQRERSKQVSGPLS